MSERGTGQDWRERGRGVAGARAGQLLLSRFLEAQGGADAEVYLGRLLVDYAKPLIRRIVASRTRGIASAADGEDLISETIAQLIERLREVASARSGRPIHDLGAYIATAAHRRCNDRLRLAYPGRARVARQIRYLIRRRPDLTMWRASSGTLLCGFQEPRDRSDSATSRDARLSGTAPRGRARIEEIVDALLARAEAPVAVDALIDAVARITGAEGNGIEVPLEHTPSNALSMEGELDFCLALRDAWQDVRRLPVSQRIALLLNLRDPGTHDPVTLLPLVRNVSAAEMSKMLGLPVDQLRAILDEAPLDDRRIGSILGVTRQEVVKLRRLARECLRRRRSAAARRAPER